MYWKNYKYIKTIQKNIQNRYDTYDNKKEALDVMNRLNRASIALSMKHLQELLKHYLDKKISKHQIIRYLKMNLGLYTSPVKKTKNNSNTNSNYQFTWERHL